MSSSPTLEVPATPRGVLATPHQLPALGELESIVADHRAILEEQKQAVAAGALGVWNGLMWDNSLMYASDAIPLSIIELWHEGVRESHAVAEGHFQVPEEFCSSGKSILGRLHLLKDVTARRVVVFAAGCDPRSIVYELLKADGYNIYTIDTVTAFRDDIDRYERYVEYLTDEFKGYGPWILGRPLDEDRLAAELHFKNGILRRHQRILDLRLRNPRLLSYRELQIILMGGSHFFNQRPRYVAFLDRIIADLERAVEVHKPGKYIPIVLSGIASLDVVRAIEASGGAIVGTVRFGSEQYREDISPYEALVYSAINLET